MELLYLVLFVCSASYAYNRKSVVFSMPMLKLDLEDPSHAGLIVSVQNVAFSISTFIVGVLSDRIHPNILFSAGLLISGFATLTFSWSSSITTFCGLWFLNGLAQGCGWPACAKILSQRASPSQFGTLWSFLSCSNNFSGSFGPFLSAFISVHFGWRWNVFTAGFLTLFLCVVFLINVSFSSDNKNIRTEEKKPSSSESKDEQGSLTDLFRDPFIWLLSISFLVVFCARTTTVDWGQMYLVEEKHHSQYVASAFTSSVEIGGFVGRMVAGYLSDWLIQRSIADSKQKSLHWKPLKRMSVALVFVLGSVACIHAFRVLVTETSSSAYITLVGALMGLCYYGPVAIFGIVSAECVPPHLSGSSHAIVALFGNVGATISGLPFSYIAKYYSWSTVFFMLEILTAGILLLMFRCRNLTPKVEKAKEV